jgi:RsiW-degrading membrane proteinase PrsW (M82 family)
MSVPGSVKAATSPSAAPWVVSALALVLLVVLGLAAMLTTRSEQGLSGFLVGVLVAFLPVPVYMGLALWLDRFESEPPWLLGTAFVWGAVVSYPAMVWGSPERTLMHFEPLLAPANLLAPVMEEGFKAAGLWLLFFLMKDEFDGVLDGLIYAIMVAVGFAFAENIVHFGRDLATGEADRLTFAVAVRGVLEPYTHPLFTAMTGIGLGLARQSRHLLVKVAGPLLGLALAIGLHFSQNIMGRLGLASAESTLGRLLVVVPCLIAVLAVVRYGLGHEAALIRELLREDLEAGRISAEEYAYLPSLRGRLKASLRALSSHGLGGFLASEGFNQAASEVALNRQRLRQGLVSPEQAQEFEARYLAVMQTLRARFSSSGGKA